MGPPIPIDLWRDLIAPAVGEHLLEGEVLQGVFIRGSSTFGAGGGMRET